MRGKGVSSQMSTFFTYLYHRYYITQAVPQTSFSMPPHNDNEMTRVKQSKTKHRLPHTQQKGVQAFIKSYKYLKYILELSRPPSIVFYSCIELHSWTKLMEC